MDKRIRPMVTFATEPCAFCFGNGSGRCKDSKIYDICPICKGMGTVLVAQPSKRCAFCSGQGSGICRDGYHYDRCPTCKGAGWAYVFVMEEDEPGEGEKAED